MPDKSNWLFSLARYGVVGVLNTAVGVATILGLQLGLGAAPHLANAAGYGVGLALGFVLNRRFVFASGVSIQRTAPRYGVAALGAFLVNQLVLMLMIRALGPGALAAALGQLAAVGSYTILFFILCRLWVFADETPA